MSRNSSLEHHVERGLKPAHDHVEETPTVIQIETFRVLGLSNEDAEFYQTFPEDKRKRVIHKANSPLIGPS